MYGSPSKKVSKEENLNLPYPSFAASLLGSHRKEDPAADSEMSSSGLLRYRSAPSSLLGELCEDFLPVRLRCPEPTDSNLFARNLPPDLEIFDKPPGGGGGGGGGGSAARQRSPRFAPPQPAGDGCGSLPSSATRVMFHSQQKQQQQLELSHTAAECSYPMAAPLAAPLAVDMGQIRTVGVGSASNLVRHGSSPAGLFSHLSAENGYAMLIGHEASRLKNQISFSSGKNSIMTQISETIGGSSSEESSGGGCFIPGTWENSSLFSGRQTIDGLNPTENREMMNPISGVNSRLTHQFSLPKTTSEMAVMEKYLQFQDAVPCKIRAKRGCATHPRSIAERVRRTRISERIRKLQELVPNMDKQTNTADMLDLATIYIKDLQKEVKTLSEGRSRCTCSSGKQKQYLNPSS